MTPAFLYFRSMNFLESRADDSPRESDFRSDITIQIPKNVSEKLLGVLNPKS